ncbi:spore-associated protein A [Nocardiopsis ansamitocini]|uniref:Spore-associated protein A n=1 Tax=Nocardiopsis ansamitocini TaxID=1670832 RepID=A0A9W6P7F3_9ACTN|nr:spore-associated protein A [Nocardiopsis ansamitocini]GLU48383.1 spore-associated protein A [Nocardiopsis ansamitocini]
MKLGKKLTALGMTTGMILAALAATAAPASAATYGGQCGSGYNVIRSASVGGQGTAFLTYRAANTTNCVVVIRNSPGAAIPMNAWLKRSNESTWQQDPGNWTTYAGPVYRSAASQCVDWGGSIGNYQVTYRQDACG